MEFEEIFGQSVSKNPLEWHMNFFNLLKNYSDFFKGSFENYVKY